MTQDRMMYTVIQDAVCGHTGVLKVPGTGADPEVGHGGGAEL